MRVLLDTNIVIHREAAKIYINDIGILFNWLDKIKAIKCIHPLTVEELNTHKDKDIVKTINIKIANYHLLKTIAPYGDDIKRICDTVDNNENDINDSKILNEVYQDRVNCLISEDKKIHKKASLLGISDRVFTINSFLEKVTAEHPDLVDYKVLAVKKLYFGEINIKDPFFDSFRGDYVGFDKWFASKSDEIAYVCYQDNNLSAFLFLKIEGEDESYSDINPILSKKKRLKIGTFKVTLNGYKLGERFLKIVFDNALAQRVSEVYVTIFDKREEQRLLIRLLEEWGFVHHGSKVTANGSENVYIRAFDKSLPANIENPKFTTPFLSKTSNIFIVPIYPQYHTELFPDSILNTESPKDFIESEPYRNALSKVYISRSHERNLVSGDIIVFYRTGSSGNAVNTGVVTTIGIVESVIENIPDEDTFLLLCRKRSVFTDVQLKEHWNHNPFNKPAHLIKRPFIVNFIYAHSLPKRPNLRWLNENGIIPDINDMPRGFRAIKRQDLINIAKYSYKK